MQNGIHHVTAIAGPARKNLDFYARVLGMRLVKKTVNFDDPGTYHLYFGDEAGSPGSILTFFPWEHAAQGRAGIGETSEVALAIPEATLGVFVQRLVEAGVAFEREARPFGETALVFRDPDGMRVALVAVPGLGEVPGWDGPVGADASVRGVHSATLLVAEAAPTAAILTDVLGFVEERREGAVTRYRAAGASIGGIVDVHEGGGFLGGRQGRGSVHHIAFRADEEGQARMVRRLAEAHGIATTPQIDRDYFRSVYFREPGGVLFEIATDDPGFTVDEPLETLGTSLKLPRRYEQRRSEIEAVLPELA